MLDVIRPVRPIVIHRHRIDTEYIIYVDMCSGEINWREILKPIAAGR